MYNVVHKRRIVYDGDVVYEGGSHPRNEFVEQSFCREAAVVPRRRQIMWFTSCALISSLG
jgi:hypothetical protein